jgi:hypothetical protein
MIRSCKSLGLIYLFTSERSVLHCPMTMRRLPPSLPPCPSQFRLFCTTRCLRQSSPPPDPSIGSQPKEPRVLQTINTHANLKDHPQAPLPSQGFGPFKRHAETGQRLTRAERTEERAKEYLYTEPDPSRPLPPLLLRPPGLANPPEEGKGHGKETRKWWQKEFEIWFGRYRKPFDVEAQLARHRELCVLWKRDLTLIETHITLNGVRGLIDGMSERLMERHNSLLTYVNAKSFMSPNAIFKAEYAKYAPNFVGRTITAPSKHFESVTFASSKNATIIALFSTQMGFTMCEPYLDAAESTFASDPSFGVIRVQFEEHWAKRALIKHYVISHHIRPLYTPEQQVFLVQKGTKVFLSNRTF